MSSAPARQPWEWAVPLVKLLAILVLALGLIVGLASWGATEFESEAASLFLGALLQGLLGFGTLAILALIAETLLESRDLQRAQLSELPQRRREERPAPRRRST